MMDMKKADQERNARTFELMMEQFIRKWSPQDCRQGADFQAQLHSLVRQIYRDAQEPVLDRLTAVIGAAPMFSGVILDGPVTIK